MKPILFNTDMVRAILDGRKAVTRRAVKPLVPKPCELRKMQEGYHAGEWHLYCENPLLDGPNHSPWGAQYLPPFHPDDVMYVRETWCKVPGVPPYIYKATCHDGIERKWHPSIHMPKEATRLFLRVTNVRVERLQIITATDAYREGIRYAGESTQLEAIVKFKDLWDSTIKKSDLDRYGWDANPWVWVIEFERCEKPEGWPQ